MLSLRQRALLGGIASGAVSVAIGTIAVFSIIDTRISAQFDKTLEDRHTQVVVALSTTTQNPAALGNFLYDPAYGVPFSGRYWQVTSSDGEIFASASLFDEVIAEPGNSADGGVIWNTPGPDDELVRSAYQKITYDDGTVWGVSVAESQLQLIAERRSAQRSLLSVFALVGVIGIASSLLLLSAIRRPLQKLQADVAQRWDSEEDLRPTDYPDEVAPLVEDLNQLLHRNRDIVSGSRRQAADLAHALKTPASILRNELMTLSQEGASTSVAQEAVDRIEAQLGRSLARMRAANTAELTHSRTNLTHSIQRLAKLFSIVAERDGKELVVDCAATLWVRMDAQDIEEVIGNLLDNAFKWSRQKVILTAQYKDGDIELRVEDDGPGVPEKEHREALRSGGRLDTSVAGTGLGLAITVDLLNAYGAKLVLGSSDVLGGLESSVFIPSSQVV